jgi:hypothetical protein
MLMPIPTLSRAPLRSPSRNLGHLREIPTPKKQTREIPAQGVSKGVSTKKKRPEERCKLLILLKPVIGLEFTT